jgi:hypothetical protein
MIDNDEMDHFPTTSASLIFCFNNDNSRQSSVCCLFPPVVSAVVCVGRLRTRKDFLRAW